VSLDWLLISYYSKLILTKPQEAGRFIAILIYGVILQNKVHTLMVKLDIGSETYSFLFVLKPQ